MRLVVISNRVPVPSEETSAGGLAVAIDDALSETGGIWFGWDGGPAKSRADTPTIVRQGAVDFATLPLTERDLDLYYRGYTNSVLWPLFHERLDAVDHRMAFRTSYQSVNAYFADGVAPMIETGDKVWVQDYHLIPLGAELRDRGIACPVGFFLHVPFPPYDIFRALPHGREVVEALFAYDLVGFQTKMDRRHFADTLRQHGVDVDEGGGTAEMNGRRMRFDAFPIGIDVERTAEIARANRDSEASRELLETEAGRKLVIGADRLDYTKGLVKRLRAFDRFLDQFQQDMEEGTTYIQIAAPSREDVDEYRSMMRRLATEAGRINGRTNEVDRVPLRLITRAVPRDTLLGYFSVADVGIVTPVRDGMNLVAKEFLAAQTEDDPGVLVLSKFAGAVEELGEAAVIVNPYDTEGVATGIHRALTMPLAERRRMWKTGMERLRANTARTWRRSFLDALGEKERRARLDRTTSGSLRAIPGDGPSAGGASVHPDAPSGSHGEAYSA